MTTLPRVVFVDLDGTLVLDNSFHGFLAALWSRGDLAARRRLVRAFALRVLGRRGTAARVAMKRRVLLAFAGLEPRRQEAVVEATIDRMGRTVSGPVAAEVERQRSAGADVVLATAAPDCYARPFAARLGIEHCLATPSTPADGWQELLGDAKADACTAWLEQRGLADAEVAVITDHPDDLSLLRLARSGFVQCAGPTFGRISGELGADFALTHVDTLAAQDGGGAWLWFDDAPSGPHDLWEIRTILSKHRYALMYVGEGRWDRVRPGSDLGAAVLRTDCPLPPTTSERWVLMLKRRVVRDHLRVFH